MGCKIVVNFFYFSRKKMHRHDQRPFVIKTLILRYRLSKSKLNILFQGSQGLTCFYLFSKKKKKKLVLRIFSKTLEMHYLFIYLFIYLFSIYLTLITPSFCVQITTIKLHLCKISTSNMSVTVVS